jgi:hypothetical protein
VGRLCKIESETGIDGAEPFTPIVFTLVTARTGGPLRPRHRWRLLTCVAGGHTVRVQAYDFCHRQKSRPSTSNTSEALACFEPDVVHMQTAKEAS